jgi:hypothetical protein
MCTRGTHDGSACHDAISVGMTGDRGPEGSSRQAGAALGATALEHGSTRAGAHTSTETVLLRTAMGVWLKSALHVVLLKALNLRGIGHTSVGPLPRVGVPPKSRAWCMLLRPRRLSERTSTAQGYGHRAPRGNQRDRAVDPAPEFDSSADVRRFRPPDVRATVPRLALSKLLSTPVDNRVDAALTSGDRGPPETGYR